MKLCKHAKYKVIDDIKDPKWMTDEVLISVNKVHEDVEHYIIRFSNTKPIPRFSSVSAQEKYGWFYMSGKMIRRFHKQKNGNGMVYVVPMSRKETFEPIKDCKCEQAEFDLFR